MGGEWTTVPTFGGGLDFSRNPAALRDDQWAWCENMRVHQQSAVTAPTYVQVIPANYAYPAPPQSIIGVLQNPFDVTFPLIVVTTEGGSPQPRRVHFYRATFYTDATNPSPLLMEIPWDGVGSPVTRYNSVGSAVQSAFLDGWLVFTVGAGPDGYSMAQWNGTGNYATIMPSGYTTFRCSHLESFAGHLVAACVDLSERGTRTIRVSDAGSGGTTIWKPAIDNSADEGVLDDSVSGITALCLLQPNALGVFTRAGAYALAPTGNIPPYTRTYAGMMPARDLGYVSLGATQSTAQTYTPFATPTPAGAAVLGYDDVYVGGAQGIGGAIYRALGRDGIPWLKRLLWHHRWGHLLVPTISTETAAALYTFTASQQAWARMMRPGSANVAAEDQTMILYGVQNSDVIAPMWKHVVVNGGAVYAETEVPPQGDTRLGLVDTRDFAMPVGRYMDRIRVDWESVSVGTTLTIEVAAREELDPQKEYPGVRPVYGYYYDLTPVFAAMPATHRVTLAPGEAEAPFNVRGKWMRIRFKHQGGQVRVRGFAFRSAVTSDRATSPDPTSGGQPISTAERHTEWDRSDFDIGKWE